MMRVLVTGELVDNKDNENLGYMHANLQLEDGRAVQLVIKKDRIKQMVRATPHRSFCNVSGKLSARCKFSSKSLVYVSYSVEVESFQSFASI